MRNRSVRLVLAAGVVTTTLLVAPPASAATSPLNPGWFDVDAPASAEAAALATRRGFIRSRQTTFDATAAVHALVPSDKLISAGRNGRTIIQPLTDALSVELLDGETATVAVDEVAVRATQDLGPRSEGAIPPVPTVELLGHIGDQKGAKAVVAFVLLPNT